jgi:hypothetical protein
MPTPCLALPNNRSELEARAVGHTPTPWRMERDGPDCTLTAKRGPLIVSPARASGTTDAAFIVLAVNAHHAMRSALEYTLLVRKIKCLHAHPGPDDSCARCRIDAALDLARGCKP